MRPAESPPSRRGHLPAEAELFYDRSSSVHAIESMPWTRDCHVFLGSSMAEHPAVNRRVAGSSPARGANYFNDLAPRPLVRFVNNREQFAADCSTAVRSDAVHHLRVHVQRRLDVRVTHQLRDHLARHALVVRPRRVGAPERQPRRVREPELRARRKDPPPRARCSAKSAFPTTSRTRARPAPCASTRARHSVTNADRRLRQRNAPQPASVFGVPNAPS